MRFIPFAALSAGVVMLASCATEASQVAHPGEDAGYLNRSDRDIPIAQKKASYLTLINTQVPPMADLNGRYFFAKCASAECD